MVVSILPWILSQNNKVQILLLIYANIGKTNFPLDMSQEYQIYLKSLIFYSSENCFAVYYGQLNIFEWYFKG